MRDPDRPRSRAVAVLTAFTDGLLAIVGVVIGNPLVLIAVMVAVPIWVVTVAPLWLLRLVTRGRFRLTLPAFMAYAAQLVTTALSRTILRRLHAGNLEEWPWDEPPRRLRDGLI